MSTYLTIWHYLGLIISLLIFTGIAIASISEKNMSTRLWIIFTGLIITFAIAAFSLMAIDKYTKVAEVYNLEHHRNFNTEEIIFTGIVKNTGDYPIGEVTLEIKMINHGNISGSVKAGIFSQPYGVTDFFSSRSDKVQLQAVLESVTIAENLDSGESRQFRIALDYPPYFKGMTLYTKIHAH